MNSSSFAFLLSNLFSQDVGENQSSGSSSGDRETSMGVSLPGFFITHSCFISQVEESADKDCDGNKGSQLSEVNSTGF